MKTVFIAFDNICHQPKSTNMLSTMQKSQDFLIDNAYIDDIQKLSSIYDELKPDVLLIDSKFEKEELKNFLLDFQRKNYNNCKLIVTFKDKQEKNDLALTKVPARLFPYKVPSDILFASFKEMVDKKIFSNNEHIYELINNLNLNLNSPITRQFKDCLEILTSDNSKYLLFGYLYNAFYTVSKLEDVSFDTVRKSVYKVKDEINKNISSTFRHSIFRDNNLYDMNLPEFFDYIVEYIDEKSAY